MDLQESRRLLDRGLREYEDCRREFRKGKETLLQASEELVHVQEAQKIIQEVAQGVQQLAHARISKIVSRCLETVFDEPYDFQIHFDRKRGKTEASLVFVRDGEEIDPLSASGGGVVDIAAFALRLSCLVLSVPSPRLFLALDEPFKFVSQEYRGRIRELILGLAKDLGVQFLIVTHIPELQVGKVISL